MLESSMPNDIVLDDKKGIIDDIIKLAYEVLFRREADSSGIISQRKVLSSLDKISDLINVFTTSDEGKGGLIRA